MSQRIITGNVNTHGVSQGAGFSSERNDTGVYTITFDEEFASVPTIVATLMAEQPEETPSNNVINVKPGAASCSVYVTTIGHGGGSFLQDAPFAFIAIGDG